MRINRGYLFLAPLTFVLSAALAQTPPGVSTQAQTPKTSIIIDHQAVRFITQGEAAEWRLVVSNGQGEVIYDSGEVTAPALEWPLQNSQGEAVASGLYTYTLTIKAPGGEAPRTQRGHLILDRPSNAERIWVTSNQSASIGTTGAETKLTVVGGSELTVGGAELPAVAAPIGKSGDASKGAKREKAAREGQATPAGPATTAGTADRVAKFAQDGATLVDSAITESANGDLGIGTPTPGGVLDLQRASSSDILQRFWNTGTGGAKLRYVAATGATSQLQLTDNAEWLMAIAGNNQTGMQFRVRAPGDPNTEAGLQAATRMTILRNGNVGIGTPIPAYKLDVADRMRVKKGTSLSAGIWFNQNTVIDQAFVGMLDDNHIGFYGLYGAGWGLTMDNTTGNVGIGTSNPAGLLHVKGANPVRILGDTNTLAGTEYVDFFARSSIFSSDLGGMRIQRQSNGNIDTVFFAAPNGNPASEKMRVSGDGNVTQSRGGGGLVKAMVYFDPFINRGSNQKIANCYNSQPADLSRGPCGFTSWYGYIGVYDIDFGFDISDRFISITPRWDTSISNDISGIVANFSIVSSTTVRIFVQYASTTNYTDAQFHIIVF